MTMNDPHAILDFYARAIGMTDPGAHAAALHALPNDLDSLVQVVQGLAIHEFVAAPMYGLQVPEDRRYESHLRSTVSMLDRIGTIDPRPISNARPPEHRLVGNCHHYAVLLLALLRSKGIPARARWGFGACFNPPYFEDHVNCEVWNAGESRWAFVEPQFDTQWTAQPGFDFDILDVPHDRFLIAGEAWTRCRRGEADPKLFGIFQGDLRGFWFIASSLVKDLAALNRVETLPWDIWGAMPQPGATLSAEQFAYFDHLAELTRDPDAHFEEVQHLFADDSGLQVPEVVFNAVRQRPEALWA